MRGLILLLIVMPSFSLLAASPEAVYSRNGMVTSRSAIASEAGVEIMRAGGNAVDAAVATGFTLAVTYPSAGNIGGGGFAVIKLSNGKVVTLDHREKAPGNAHKDMFLDENGAVIAGLSTRSHKAAGVPGSVDGLLILLDTYGTMSRKKILQPVIELARQGFPLTEDLARQFRRIQPDIQEYPASVRKFTSKGEAYEAGDIWRQPDLADSLKRISDAGKDGFYRGRIADLIVAEMHRGGGDISLDDLADYSSVWRLPVHGNYRGYDIWGMGPPSSGGTLLVQMLNMLEPFNLKEMGWGSAAVIHHMVEAERLAYADRAEYLGDPDFHELPVSKLISKEYARIRFADFDPGHAGNSKDVSAGSWPEESHETTHFSIMDASGMMVALTTTLNSSFGSKIVVPGTGILLNNEMDDFSVSPDSPNQLGLTGGIVNAIEPGKRMLSSMSPTLVTLNGEPVLTTGSPGGSMIITTVLQVIINVIDHGMGIGDAVSLPRFHHQWKPDEIKHGKFAISPDTRVKLEQMGHRNFIEYSSGRGIGDANSILFRDGVFHGIKDPRNEGAATGY